MARKEIADVAAARLPLALLEKNFSDVAPPLDRQRALIEAQRCHYCYDAPCITACPTGIDIPSFIRGITTDNLRGAAETILDANIFGGICARVCPTEILCEGECVRNGPEEKPVEISALQRYATDWVYVQNAQLFERADATGKRIAVVGAGPAGLACAHALARLGHQVTVFEAREKAGGLNEYGIAAYKVPGFAEREIEWLLSIGGIEIRNGQVLGKNLWLEDLRNDHDAVFLGMGLAGVNALGMAGESIDGVRNAVDFIAELRQSPQLSTLPIGRRVVVIGGGNTAIDAAVQSRKLGAESVTLVYRRGPESMSATDVEQAYAQTEGVHVIHYAQPHAIASEQGQLASITFEHTHVDADGRLLGSGEFFSLPADSVLKAIGQVLRVDGISKSADELSVHKGRIRVDEHFATSVPGVWAGGDCVGGKVDLTVQAVEDGKRAARAIHAAINNVARGASHG